MRYIMAVLLISNLAGCTSVVAEEIGAPEMLTPVNVQPPAPDYGPFVPQTVIIENNPDVLLGK